MRQFVGSFSLLSRKWNERLDALVDDLIGDGSVEAAFLASIVMTAQDSVRKGEHVALSRRLWSANNDLNPTDGGGASPPSQARRRPAV
jgi:hypothetical protein